MPISDFPAFEGSGSDTSTPEFVDEPLDAVVQDNLDIRCQIGSGPLTGDSEPSGGRPYDLVSLEVHLSDGAESNYAVGMVVPDGHDEKPEAGDALRDGLIDPDIISIDVDTELSVEREDATEEITRIFTGIISNSSRVEKGMYEFMAFWPGYSEIQNESISVSLPTPDYEIINTAGGQIYHKPDYTNRWQYASIVAEEVAEKITSDGDFGYNINLTEEGTFILGTPYGRDTQLYMDSTYLPITLDGHDEGILERVVTSTNSVWEVDRYGRLNIGPPIPREDVPEGQEIPTAIDSYKLRYITETTAGLQSPAWRSILVIGDGVVSQDGWGAGAQINENPQQYAEPITDAFATEEDISDELAEPVFEYTNLEINTAKEAKNVLNQLKDKIRKQVANGEITVVGYPEIWPGDVVELPDSENQPFGLKRFGVGKVIHRLNNQDGFITKIQVAGMTNANEAVYSDQVDIPDDSNRYGTYYSENETTRFGGGIQ